MPVTPNQRKILAYLAAPALVGAALFLRTLLLGQTDNVETDVLLLAVLLTAAMGGIGPGLLATGTAVLLDWYLFRAPAGSLAIASRQDRVEIGLFLIGGVVVSVIVESLRRARGREAAAKGASDAKEEALRQTALRHALALEGSRLGGWDWIVGEPTTTVNRRWREIVGVEGEGDETACPNDLWMSRIHPDDAKLVIGAARDLVEGRLERYDHEYRIPAGDGQWRWVRSRAMAVARNPDGTARRVAGTLADISDRKAAEQVVRASQSRLRAYFDSPAVGIAISSLEKGWVDVNERACSMLGYSREELFGKTWLELTHPDDVARDVAEFNRVVAGEIDRYSLDKRFIRKDGSILWTLLSVSAVRRTDGSIDCFVAILNDITERKRAEEARLASEERMRNLIRHLPVPTAVVGPDERVSFNERFTEVLGYTQDDVPDFTTWTEVAYPDPECRAQALAAWSESLRESEGTGGLVRAREYQVCAKDGSQHTMDISAVRVGEDLVASLVDVTERRKAEEEVRQTRSQFALVLEGTNDGFWDWDVPTGHVAFSQSTASMLGYEMAELEPNVSTWERLIHPDDAASVRAAVEAHLRGESNQFVAEHRALHKDGRWLWLLDRGKVAARAGDGSPLRMAGTYTDITGRKVAEEALVRSERRLRELIDALPVPLAVNDRELRITKVNRKFVDLLGYAPEEVPDVATWFRLAYPDEAYRAEVSKKWSEAIREARGGEIAGREYRVACKDGTTRTMEISGVPVGEDLVVNLVDVTARVQAEAAVRASESRFRSLAELAPVGIFEGDADGNNTYTNAAAAAIWGLTPEQARGRGWHRAVHPEDRERAVGAWQLAFASDQQVFNIEHRFQTPEGKVAWARVYVTSVRDPAGRRTGFVGVLVDVTEQRAVEQRLAVAGRLAAMGTLVSGVAHEVNNPLTGLMAGIGTALEDVAALGPAVGSGRPPDREAILRIQQELRESLEDAAESGRRIAQIVKDLAIFGGPGQQRVRVNLPEVAAAALRWLPAATTALASVKVEDRGSPDVLAARGQIEQVLVNLISNAAKATPAGQHGAVLVRLGPGSSGMARIEVIDHGTGIPASVLGQIFDPFFTTRPLGERKGSGLGLAICHAIVSSHGGTITVESEVGKGSTFRLELPVAPAEP